MVVVAGKYCPESLSNSVIITEGRNLEEVLQVNRLILLICGHKSWHYFLTVTLIQSSVTS